MFSHSYQNKSITQHNHRKPFHGLFCWQYLVFTSPNNHTESWTFMCEAEVFLFSNNTITHRLTVWSNRGTSTPSCSCFSHVYLPSLLINAVLLSAYPEQHFLFSSCYFGRFWSRCFKKVDNRLNLFNSSPLCSPVDLLGHVGKFLTGFNREKEKKEHKSLTHAD